MTLLVKKKKKKKINEFMRNFKEISRKKKYEIFFLRMFKKNMRFFSHIHKNIFSFLKIYRHLVSPMKKKI